MSTTWTLVYQPSKFSPHLQPTGDVYATWEAAREAYVNSRDERLVQAYATYLVTADCTEMEGETGRVLQIAPTAAQKAAAKERKTRIAQILATAAARNDFGLGERILRGWGNRVGATTLEEAATAAVDRGMTWSDICFTQS